jgi:uncharacterized protein YjiS (DUF1127 family)
MLHMHSLHSSIAEASIVQMQHSLKYGGKKRANGGTQMAYYTQTRSYGLVERSLYGLSRFFRELSVRYVRARIYRTSLNELNALSDREIADLGLTRSEFPALAREAAMSYPAR